MNSGVQCPECKFANRGGERTCLMCKSTLPVSANGDATLPRIERPPEPDEPAPQPTSKINSSSVDVRDVIAWLSCEPLDPVPLVPGSVVSVGRSPDCDLVLRHKSVSRRQGVVKVHGKTLNFSDEGSSNGTFLNGKRTTSATLRAGDMLTFGPYEVEIHSNESITDLNQEMDLEGTQVIEVSSITTGLLHEASLAELLQGIEFNQKSGTLSILSGNIRGSMAIRDGKPVSASLGGDRDEEAAIRMLILTEGRYTFAPHVDADETTMKASITGLLLEASRRADDAGG